jgi:hypothetical protein
MNSEESDLQLSFYSIVPSRVATVKAVEECVRLL